MKNYGYNEEELVEVKLHSEPVFHGIIMDIYRDEILLPDGNKGIRELMRHSGAVCIVPVTDRGTVILEQQYRYTVGKVLTEIPAGKLNAPEEDRLLAAKRELLEETGLSADSWVSLGEFYPAPAYSDEKITVFLARKLHSGNQELDPDEFLRVFELPIEELLEHVMNGMIEDEKTQFAVLKAYYYMKNERKAENEGNRNSCR